MLVLAQTKSMTKKISIGLVLLLLPFASCLLPFAFITVTAGRGNRK
jgi:hypothetical protein